MAKDKISLDNLFLYLNNPRIPSAIDENDAILKIVEDQGEKIVSLAKDILEFGLSPLDIIGVFPSEDGSSFIVAEGNRRITALKLLKNPEIIKEKYPSIYKKFLKLSDSNKFKFDKLDVEVFDSINNSTVNHILELRHLGDNDGKGTAKWNATQKDRYRQRIYGQNKYVDFFDQIISKDILSKSQYLEVTYTNWKRILDSIKSLEYLGITLKDKSFVLPDDIDTFKKKISIIAEKLKNKTVKAVYDKEALNSFFEDVDKTYQELNHNTNKNHTNIESSTTEINKNINYPDSEQSDYSNSNSKDKYIIPSDMFKNCRTLIPKAWRVQSSNNRITKIIGELKALDVETYPNSCGVLLRALIELSAKDYLERILDEKTSTEDEFMKVITRVNNDLRNKKIIDNQIHSAIANEIDNTRLLFNGYLHNTDAYPSSQVIKQKFQIFMKFIEASLTAEKITGQK